MTTPATPGHVFEAVVNPITNKLVSFTNLGVEGAQQYMVVAVFAS